MRAESKHESPSSEGSPPPKQDPLERRRLQNRLSQRNHRRKIRDRIAKLQERVIANELRAAASLNGWDQTYSQSLISTRHSHQEPELFFGSRDSPQSTEPCTPFFSPYMFSNPTYSADINLSQSPELCADPFRHFESECLGSTAQNMSGCEIGFLGNEQDIENFHDPWGNLNTRSSIMADSRSGSTINQPNIYVATAPWAWQQMGHG
ncbi:hypothetical protein N7454_009468 [Penicillium verhagenii]|nr:hypothetical protein N7454_009468 [Penicillium verhagenii]